MGAQVRRPGKSVHWQQARTLALQLECDGLGCSGLAASGACVVLSVCVRAPCKHMHRSQIGYKQLRQGTVTYSCLIPCCTNPFRPCG